MQASANSTARRRKVAAGRTYRYNPVGMYCVHCGKRMTKAVPEAEEPAGYLSPCGRVQVQATTSTLLTFPDGMTAAGQLPTLFQSDLFGNPPHGYCPTSSPEPE